MVCGIYIYHYQCILQRLIIYFMFYVSLCHSAAASRHIFHEVVNNYFPILQKYLYVAACWWPGHGACHSSCCLHFLTLFSGCAGPVRLTRCSISLLEEWFIHSSSATHLAWHTPVSTRPGPVHSSQQSGTTSPSSADIEAVPRYLGDGGRGSSIKYRVFLV